MKCSEIIKILETLSPRSMACDWGLDSKTKHQNI